MADWPPKAVNKDQHVHSTEMSVLVKEGTASSTQLTGMVRAAVTGPYLHNPAVGSA